MMTRPFSLLATLSLVTVATAQNGSLEQELSILSDRFHLSFPKEAKNEARAVDIMSAPPGEDAETRIVLDRGDERVVFFAQEMQTLGSPDLVAGWKRAIEEPGADAFEVKSTRKEASLEIVGFAPRQVAEGGEAVLVQGIVVRCADGMLMNMVAYINPTAREHLDKYQKLITDIFNSLRPGTRVMDLSAHVVRFPFYGSQTQELVIDLPAGHVITTDDAYDFFVYRIRKVPILGEEGGQAAITLYLGHHPSLMLKDLGRSEAGVPRKPGTLFGKPMEWLVVDDEESHTHIQEQIVPMDDEGDLVAHVAVVGNDPEQVKMMVSLAERIKVEP